MCKAWDDHKQSGINEGRLLGQQEGRLLGQQEGQREGLCSGQLGFLYELLGSYSDQIPETLKKQLDHETDPDRLKQYFRLALQCKTCGEFAKRLLS